jgi:1,2-diacylglycerol 3-beta-glucosyltransferase
MMFQIATIILLIPACFVTFYYLGLALYSLALRREASERGDRTDHSFAIIIPAHNEEKEIAQTLESCASLDYPRHQFRVYVVADNCSDRTAEMARENGATVLERRDESRKGKGYALEWAFNKILPAGNDALIVLDADSRLERHSLRAFSHCLASGIPVAQVNNLASNPDDSVLSYMVAVGNWIENELFYVPKSALGLAVFLRGTGMMFKREILIRVPWKVNSVAEDAEYTIDLLTNEIPVAFLREVRVSSGFPVNCDQLNVQRTRWARGNIGLAKRRALGLMWDGIRHGRVKWIDGGWTLLVLSRPIILLELFIAILLAIIAVVVSPGAFSTGLLYSAILLAVLQGIYFLGGILGLGLTTHRMGLLVRTPASLARLIFLSVVGSFRSGPAVWGRTPR